MSGFRRSSAYAARPPAAAARGAFLPVGLPPALVIVVAGLLFRLARRLRHLPWRRTRLRGSAAPRLIKDFVMSYDCRVDLTVKITAAAARYLHLSPRVVAQGVASNPVAAELLRQSHIGTILG